jgi:excisionase family DNA binding protein
VQPENALWSIEDVAAYLRVPVNSVYKMTAQKARTPIPHVKIGGRLRFRKADIDRWLDLLMVSNLETLDLDKVKRAALLSQKR